MKYSWYI